MRTTNAAKRLKGEHCTNCAKQLVEVIHECPRRTKGQISVWANHTRGVWLGYTHPNVCLETVRNLSEAKTPKLRPVVGSGYTRGMPEPAIVTTEREREMAWLRRPLYR